MCLTLQRFLKTSPLESTEPGKSVWMPSSERQKSFAEAGEQGDPVHALRSKFLLTP